jgi:hypothetical protein
MIKEETVAADVSSRCYSTLQTRGLRQMTSCSSWQKYGIGGGADRTHSRFKGRSQCLPDAYKAV